MNSPASLSLPIAWPPPGHYILAVSGGADSMVLLDVMAAAAPGRGYNLTVAHFDHGLRPGSGADRRFVQAAAARYSLPFEAREGKLGQASEAVARAARHAFLEQVRRAHRGVAVLTAHHQDDLLETSLLNLARGTGRRGLAPMQQDPALEGVPTPLSGAGSDIGLAPIIRPLLGTTRRQLREYAADHRISWREDPTNTDLSNPRNFLRHHLLTRATPAWREHYLELISRLARLNQEIDTQIKPLLAPYRTDPVGYAWPRALIRNLSLVEVAELLAVAIARLTTTPGVIAPNVNERLLLELALFAKTGRTHRYRPVGSNLTLSITGLHVSLATI